MSSMAPQEFTVGTAVGRWAGIGPYYAMFPLDFAFKVVQTYSAPGQSMLDPFAGRASSVYAAATTQRRSFGVEINPVGWLYGHVKLHPAGEVHVKRRLSELMVAANLLPESVVEQLPEFFHTCFAPRVLRFLSTARAALRWQASIVDATLMAIILIYLHGKQGQALSNQMRQGKSMSPDYSVRWWHDRNLTAPDLDPYEFISKRVAWRYRKGIPSLAKGSVVLGDSRLVIRRLASRVARGQQEKFDLLFTSPPYYAVTNYHYDQWLRLWMLGGADRPTRLGGEDQKRFESMPNYRALLKDVFGACALVMAPSATVYVRTDARKFTFETTLDVLRETFPAKKLQTVAQPFRRNTQTALFGDKGQKPGEVDIILR